MNIIKQSLILFLIGFTLNLSAQTYALSSTTTGTYTDLVGSTSLNNGMTWDDPLFAIPMGFDFDFFDTTINLIHISDIGLGGELVPSADYSMDDKILVVFGSDIVDRGDNTSTSQSNLSYLLDGTPGSHILKVEWNNVGFYSELYDDGMSTDFVNFQVWFYEGSNDIEIHFGPNSVTQPNLCYDNETGTHIGLYPEVDYYSSTLPEDAFLLKDDPSMPTAYWSNTPYDQHLNGTIPNGAIFKFANVMVNNSNPELVTMDLEIYPNPCQNSFRVIQTGDEHKIEMITILNATGKKVKEINYTDELIDISELSSGIYFIQTTTEEGLIASRRLVKQ